MTDIDIQYAISSEGLPGEEQLQNWAQHVLKEQSAGTELTIRIVDAAEITALNKQYRGKDGPTNVLSFPYEPMPGVESGLLGDVVICAPVVFEEAITQDKQPDAHWAHMVVHGILHLQGYDHHHDTEASRMEEKEVAVLAELGFSDPYKST